jgi:16S rRNA (cytidine1402-2'-O)-methyltransferase
MAKGKLYMFPVPLGEESATKVIPHYNVSVLSEVEFVIAEDAKTARKWMKQMGCEKPLQDFDYEEVNNHTRGEDLNEILKPLFAGKITAFMSEAGCPGIADPGSEIVRICHNRNIEVIPLVGPSSILLALMGSGFSGQNFCFNGYLPR